MNQEPTPQPTVAWQPPQPPPSSGPARFSWSDFFSFRYMITPVVIRVIYILGAVLISIGSVGYVTTGILGAGGLVAAILVLLLGNLYWRVLMELIMVLFGIHEGVRSMERKDRG